MRHAKDRRAGRGSRRAEARAAAQAPVTAGGSVACPRSGAKGGGPRTCIPPELSADARTREINWAERVAGGAGRLACATVERLRGTGRQQREDARCRRADQEGVGNTARCERDSARSDPVVLPIDVHEDLALQHVEDLILVRVDVQRGRLALPHEILEQQQRTAGFLGGRLHGQDAPPQKRRRSPSPSARTIVTAVI